MFWQTKEERKQKLLRKKERENIKLANSKKRLRDELELEKIKKEVMAQKKLRETIQKRTSGKKYSDVKKFGKKVGKIAKSFNEKAKEYAKDTPALSSEFYEQKKRSKPKRKEYDPFSVF